jgi:hypothetical protein
MLLSLMELIQMHIHRNNLWQLGCGSSNRTYADQFYQFGVGLIGPGDAGAWTADRDDSDYESGSVRHFASEATIGDVVLLRSGTSRLLALGLVASPYMYLPQFEDVNGWDLQHARRIRWYRLPTEYDFDQPVFGAFPRRFSRVGNPEVIALVERFLNSPPVDWHTGPLPQLPSEEPVLSDVPAALRNLVALAHDLGSQFYWDRQNFGEHPSEDEMIAHFVVPFFQALGWPPEKIAIKWRFIDVAIFGQLPRVPVNCALIVEVKQLGAGVEGALGQGTGYATAQGVACDVLVTDGVRYRLYSKTSDYQPIAYANLARLKQSALELVSRLRRP